MVQNNEIIGATENLTLLAKYRVNQCRYNRVQLCILDQWTSKFQLKFIHPFTIKVSSQCWLPNLKFGTMENSAKIPRFFPLLHTQVEKGLITLLSSMSNDLPCLNLTIPSRSSGHILRTFEAINYIFIIFQYMSQFLFFSFNIVFKYCQNSRSYLLVLK